MPDSGRRTRVRRHPLNVDKAKIFNRANTFYQRDLSDRTEEREHLLQLTAKLQMWEAREDKDWPWEGASNIALPDILTASLRTQDTLHNAVMSGRPPVASKAIRGTDTKKQEAVDKTLDYQFFVEAPGEKILADFIYNFCNDPSVTVYVPWVTEHREVADMQTFPPIPENALPFDYFQAILAGSFPDVVGMAPKAGSDAWDWVGTRPTEKEGEAGERVEVRFYTREDAWVQMVTVQKVTIFDGPRPIVFDYDDVFWPFRAANLQAPSPSNPNGSAHVILRDYPTIDEIKKLYKSRYYNLMTDEDYQKLDNFSYSDTDNEGEQQKDSIQGTPTLPDQYGDEARSHNKITRLRCFDLYDINGDGVAEDMMWWILVEPQILAKAARLGEAHPSATGSRPFAETSFMPMPDRKAGMSMPMLLEGIHDAEKTLFDQIIDSGTIDIVPFGFYKPHGTMKPEPIRLDPGELYPLGDPKNDINFPQVGNTGRAFGINMLTMLQQMEERLSMIGDMQYGKVPAGKSSALRTLGGMQLLAGQGEARPERILRRMFMGLTEIWRLMHGLNQRFLTGEKHIRVLGVMEGGEDPYLKVTPGDLSGHFQFDFQANVFNASKAALQQGLQMIGQTFVNPLLIQMGITTPDTVFRWAQDFAKAWGLDESKYASRPTPQSDMPPITAKMAIDIIVGGAMPEGPPAEGAAAHLETLTAFQNGQPPFDEETSINLLDANQQGVFAAYVQKVQQMVAQEQQQQQLLAAAQQFQQGQQGGAGRPGEGGQQIGGNPQISGEGELIDESLPGAGGGAVQ